MVTTVTLKLFRACAQSFPLVKDDVPSRTFCALPGCQFKVFIG